MRVLDIERMSPDSWVVRIWKDNKLDEVFVATDAEVAQFRKELNLQWEKALAAERKGEDFSARD